MLSFKLFSTIIFWYIFIINCQNDKTEDENAEKIMFDMSKVLCNTTLNTELADKVNKCEKSLMNTEVIKVIEKCVKDNNEPFNQLCFCYYFNQKVRKCTDDTMNKFSNQTQTEEDKIAGKYMQCLFSLTIKSGA